MKRFLKILLAGYFLVTWNEHKLKTTQPCEQVCDGGSCWNWPIGCKDGDIFSIEITTESVQLATQKDVDLFVGHEEGTGYTSIYHLGIIPVHAFNVKMEKKE